MKVLFDHQAFNMQKMGGVSRGFVEVVSRLKDFGIDWEISIKDCANVYLLERLPEVKLTGKFETKYDFRAKYPWLPLRGKIFEVLKYFYLVRSSEWINKRLSVRKIIEGNYDIFHATFLDTYFLKYLKYIGKKPLVITIHDMTPDLFPHLCYIPSHIVAKETLKKYASHIIVPSQNTKNDVVKILHYPEERIKVIHWGADILSEEYLNSLPRIVPQDYLLFVGGRGGYKGFNTFLSEFRKVHEKHSDLYLVCTGSPFREEEKQLIAKLGLTDYVRQQYVNQQELHSLYRYAKGFVFPSQSEGFGIPVYEAFSCGCPTFLNNATCFPEVGRNGAKYFQQDETSSTFSSVFFDYLEHEEAEKLAMTTEGLNIIKASSWEKTAQEYAAFYKEIAR